MTSNLNKPRQRPCQHESTAGILLKEARYSDLDPRESLTHRDNAKMVVRASSAPQLTKMSMFKTQPKYTFSVRIPPIESHLSSAPPPNKYDVRGLMEHTSKFSRTQRCSFGSAKRFEAANDRGNKTGPGSYNSNSSTLSHLKCGFGTSVRPPITESLGAAKGPAMPGPGLYEVRGKNRRNDPTLSDSSCTHGGRHKWFYENLEAERKPGPGTYSRVSEGLKALEHRDPTFGFGSSTRPAITESLGVGKNTVGPGQYPTPSTLGGNVQLQKVPAYSFTSSGGRIPKKGGEKSKAACPDMVAAGTQFGY